MSKRLGSPHLEGTSGSAHERHHSASKQSAAIAAAPTVIQKYIIWPEWPNDIDLLNEKWEGVPSKAKDKKEDKKLPAALAHLFDDPEGKINLPDGLVAASWKRPSEYVKEPLCPVIVDLPGQFGFDLVNQNEHLIRQSETMRWIISQIYYLWHACATRGNPVGDPIADANISIADSMVYNWHPWEHIYSLVQKPPVGKASSPPAPVQNFNYNPAGKYLVKLYWLGLWRKITVDDTIPFDENDRPLLPVTSIAHEIWPLILTKALLKIAALASPSGGQDIRDFKDFSPIHCFTSWIPEVVPIQAHRGDKLWELLSQTLPNWQYEDPVFYNRVEKRPPAEGESSGGLTDSNPQAAATVAANASQERQGSAQGRRSGGKVDEKVAKGSVRGKASDKAKEKAAAAVVQQTQDDLGSLTEGSVALVCASYSVNTGFPPAVSTLSTVADNVARLHQCGLAAAFGHPVLLRKTRALPLQRPPERVVQPDWKKIRPRRPKGVPWSEPQPHSPPDEPIQSLEFFSPLLRFRLPQVPLPSTSASRPTSALQRRSTRRARSASSVLELDESLPEAVAAAPLPVAEPPKPPEPPAATRATRRSASQSPSSGRGTPQTPPGDRRRTARDLRTGRGRNVQQPVEAPPLMTPTQIPRLDVPTHSDWVDVSQVACCFQNVILFHKPLSYPFTYKLSDLELLLTPKEKEKKGAVATSSPVLVTQTGGTAVGNVTSLDDKMSPLYLFVDSLKPFSLLVTLSSLCVWNDPNTIIVTTVSTEPVTNTKKDKKDKEHRETVSERKSWADENQLSVSNPGGDTGRRSSFSLATPASDLLVPQTTEMTPGVVIFETHSWLRTESIKPVMQLKSTGLRSTVINLPAGRHLFHVVSKAPITHSFMVCSQTAFHCGDEDSVLQFLTKESTLFLDYGASVLRAVSKLIQLFGQFGGESMEVTEQIRQIRQLVLYLDTSHSEPKGRAIQLFRDALYTLLKRALGDSLGKEHLLAWRALTFDTIIENIFGVIAPVLPAKLEREPAETLKVPTKLEKSNSKSPRKPTRKEKEKEREREKEADQEKRNKAAGNAKEKEKPEKFEKESSAQASVDIALKWQNRELTEQERFALQSLQRFWRSYYVRRLKRARTLGNPLHEEVYHILQKSWSVVEANLEQHAQLFTWDLLRQLANMLNTQHPPAVNSLMNNYDYGRDEPFMLLYSDYSDAIRPPPAAEGRQQWFMMFRETFQLPQDTLISTRLSTSQSPNVAQFALHVIDNDTLEEVNTVFAKPAAQLLEKNKTGYTVLAEARLVPLPSNLPGQPAQTLPNAPNARWKLRIFRPINTAPAKVPKAELTSQFATKEIKDYYVPNEASQLTRFQVKWSGVTRTAMSAYLEVSNPEVVVLLKMYDRNEMLACVQGRQRVLLPLAFLKPDSNAKVETEKKKPARPGKRVPQRKDTKTEKAETTTTDEESSERPPSCTSSLTDLAEAGKLPEIVHKYLLEAYVLPNKHGELWKLSDADIAHVQHLVATQQQTVNSLKMAPEPSTNPLHSPTTVGSVFFGSGASLVNTVSGGLIIHSNLQRERDQSGSRTDKRDGTGRTSRADNLTKSTSEAAKKRQAKDKLKDAQPAAPLFDETKPYFGLTLVFDNDAIENIDLRVDAELYEQRAAMKRAWEAADPGREQRASRSRAKYLLRSALMADANGNLSAIPPPDLSEPPPRTPTVATPPLVPPTPTQSGRQSKQQVVTPPVPVAKVQSPLDAGLFELLSLPVLVPEQLVESEPRIKSPSLPLLAPAVTEKRIVLQPVDLSNFRFGVGDSPRLKTDEVYLEELEVRQAEMDKFRNMNEIVELYRIEEFKERNLVKYLNFSSYDKLQAKVDFARFGVLSTRQAYRQRLIDAAEAKRQAELKAKAEQEALLLAAKEKEKKSKRGKTPPKRTGSARAKTAKK